MTLATRKVASYLLGHMFGDPSKRRDRPLFDDLKAAGGEIMALINLLLTSLACRYKLTPVRCCCGIGEVVLRLMVGIKSIV